MAPDARAWPGRKSPQLNGRPRAARSEPGGCRQTQPRGRRRSPTRQAGRHRPPLQSDLALCSHTPAPGSLAGCSSRRRKPPSPPKLLTCADLPLPLPVFSPPPPLFLLFKRTCFHSSSALSPRNAPSLQREDELTTAHRPRCAAQSSQAGI